MVAPLAAFPTRRDGEDWVIELGDLASLQELNVPLRVSFVSQGIGGPIGTAVRLSFSVAGASISRASADVVWTIVTGPEVGAQARNRRVDRAVAQAYAALASREAGHLNREGEYTAARDRLTHVASRIHGYAGDDAELNALVRKLQQDAQAHHEPMAAFELKARYMVSERSLKSRDVSGGSTRRPNGRA